jgi:YD repeat-containing protein
MGRLIGTTTSYGFLTNRSFTNAYTYDAASNRTGFTDPENGSTTGPNVAECGLLFPAVGCIAAALVTARLRGKKSKTERVAQLSTVG